MQTCLQRHAPDFWYLQIKLHMSATSWDHHPSTPPSYCWQRRWLSHQSGGRLVVESLVWRQAADSFVCSHQTASIMNLSYICHSCFLVLSILNDFRLLYHRPPPSSTSLNTRFHQIWWWWWRRVKIECQLVSHPKLHPPTHHLCPITEVKDCESIGHSGDAGCDQFLHSNSFRADLWMIVVILNLIFRWCNLAGRECEGIASHRYRERMVTLMIQWQSIFKIECCEKWWVRA